jgi:hypothetical protein
MLRNWLKELMRLRLLDDLHLHLLQHHLLLYWLNGAGHKLNRAAQRLNRAGRWQPASLVTFLANEKQVVQTLSLMALLATCCDLKEQIPGSRFTVMLQR